MQQTSSKTGIVPAPGQSGGDSPNLAADVALLKQQVAGLLKAQADAAAKSAEILAAVKSGNPLKIMSLIGSL